MVLRTALFAFFLIGIGSSASFAGVRIPLGAAMAQCAQTAAVYGQTLFGQGGETVEAARQQALYRGCVRAKSGQYPSGKADKTGVWIHGSAVFGIVVK